MFPQAGHVLLEEIGRSASGDWQITNSLILPDTGTMENLFGRSSKTYKELFHRSRQQRPIGLDDRSRVACY
jgi:hypothetical protein